MNGESELDFEWKIDGDKKIGSTQETWSGISLTYQIQTIFSINSRSLELVCIK